MRIALSLYHSLLLFDDQGQGIWSSLIPLSLRSLSLCLRTQAKRTAQKDINTGTSKAGSPIFCGTFQKGFRSAEIYELSIFTCQFQWSEHSSRHCQMSDVSKTEILWSAHIKQVQTLWLYVSWHYHTNTKTQKLHKTKLCVSIKQAPALLLLGVLCFSHGLVTWASFLLIAYLRCVTLDKEKHHGFQKTPSIRSNIFEPTKAVFNTCQNCTNEWN